MGGIDYWFELLTHGDAGGVREPEAAIFSLLMAFLIGHMIGWIYMWTHQALSYSQTFVASLVTIPVIIALMMMLMSGNMAVAFGLLAVFAVVRFRNVLKDTRDTTFILWVIIEGMAVGTMRYTTAIIGLASVALVLLYLRTTAFGSRHRFDAVLTVQLTGDLAIGVTQLKEILHRHSARVHLANQRRLTDVGLDLSYRLLLRDPSRGDELRMEMQQTDGMENVALYMREDESEV